MPDTVFNPLVKKGLDMVQNLTDLDDRFVNITGDNLEGNLTADAGVLIDGYDVSVEFASIDTGIDGGAF